MRSRPRRRFSRRTGGEDAVIPIILDGENAWEHFREGGHPLIRSAEPGESWSWCYVDDLAMLIPEVTGETRIPPSPLSGPR